MNKQQTISQLLATLKDAEFIMRKVSEHPREVMAMADSLKRSAEDARELIARVENQ